MSLINYLTVDEIPKSFFSNDLFGLFLLCIIFLFIEAIIIDQKITYSYFYFLIFSIINFIISICVSFMLCLIISYLYKLIFASIIVTLTLYGIYKIRYKAEQKS